MSSSSLVPIPWLVSAVFVSVLCADLALVSAAGTDIPFQDQWDVEGRHLLPRWIDGSLSVSDLFLPHNEHRIAWTLLLDLGLFSINGQWDPILQLVACGLLRAGVAAGLASWLGTGRAITTQFAISAGMTLAFLPGAAWHNALSGFQTQVFFCLGFSLVALASLGRNKPTCTNISVGFSGGVAALFAMAPGALVPVALLLVLGLRSVERRQLVWREWLPSIVLLMLALLLRPVAPAHAELQPATPGLFLMAAGRALAWPHTAQPHAALVMMLPFAAAVYGRLTSKQWARAVDDTLIVVGMWAFAIALAAAWLRGGSSEWAAGVPSRYGDFLVLLPIVNVWCAWALARRAMPKKQLIARFTASVWSAFLFAGWVGLSAEALRRVVLPRSKDVNAPVHLAQAFQQTNDGRMFDGQPRLLVPHPNLDLVRAALDDSRMHGRLPPSLQTDSPMGPLSKAVRWLLRR